LDEDLYPIDWLIIGVLNGCGQAQSLPKNVFYQLWLPMIGEPINRGKLVAIQWQVIWFY